MSAFQKGHSFEETGNLKTEVFRGVTPFRLIKSNRRFEWHSTFIYKVKQFRSRRL